ncbi:MAG: outer membrane lipoprotein-sorting protein [Pseudomonadota bacterium]
MIVLPALTLATTLLVGAAPAKAPVPEMDAATILKKAMARNLFGLTGTANASMEVHTTRGEVKNRDLAVKLMRSEAGLQRALVSFRSPVEVAGTAFLVVERPEGPPDQYLYLPALKKVRRIAAGQATDSFMGSDFTFLDLSPLPQGNSGEIEFKRLEDATVGGQPAYVIEALSKIPGSPYSRVLTSIHREHLVPLKIEFFDQSGKPLKVLTMKKLKKIDGKLIPVELEMKNQQKNSWTVLGLTELDLKAKPSEADFTPEAMQGT